MFHLNLMNFLRTSYFESSLIELLHGRLVNVDSVECFTGVDLQCTTYCDVILSPDLRTSLGKK